MPDHDPNETRAEVSAILAQTGPVGACQHLRLTGPFSWLERHESWAPLDYGVKPCDPRRSPLRFLRRDRCRALISTMKRFTGGSTGPRSHMGGENASPARAITPASAAAAPRSGRVEGVLEKAVLRAYRSPRVQAMLARMPGDRMLAPSPGAGALLVCREGTPGYTEQAFRLAWERGIPLIYDTDDLLIALPDDSPFAARFRPMRPLLTRWIRQADHLTVANTALAEELAELNPSISILPSFLDVDLWGVSPIPLPGEGPVSVGFWGCSVHVPDLQRLTAVFRHLKQRYGRRLRFQFMGCHDPEMLALEDVSVGAFVNSYAGYAAATRDCRLDIAIAPMACNRFNRCKSPIKFFEYSIRGACGIYTDFDPYQAVVRHGENGFLVGTSTDEWLGALESLIDNPDLRYRMACQAQADVLAHHTLDHHAWRWREAYQTAIQRCPQPSKGGRALGTALSSR